MIRLRVEMTNKIGLYIHRVHIIAAVLEPNARASDISSCKLIDLIKLLEF